MQSSELSNLVTQVLWAGFAASFLFGVVAQRTHFCTMGAISDVVNMGDWTRARQWAFAVGLAMLGFGLMHHVGLIDPAKTLYGTKRWMWASAIVGGLLFGFGMVLASGCGSKTLVRIGTGNLKSLVVFVVMGLAAFATLRGITAVARVSTVDRWSVETNSIASLPFLLADATGVGAARLGLILSLVLGGALLVWALADSSARRSKDLWLAGIGIGLSVLAAWWVSGGLGHVAEHPETLEEVFVGTPSGRIEALSFTAPMAYVIDWLIYFSDKNKVMTLAVASVAGVVSGSTVSALFFKEFRWEGFGGTEDLANHLVGAVLMGVGGVTALGCTIGQGLSGLSTLHITSLVAVVAIVLGAVGALRYQMWRLERAV